MDKLECGGCGEPIEIGKEYINLCLTVEKENKDNTTEVIGNAISLVTYHIKCYPDIKKELERRLK